MKAGVISKIAMFTSPKEVPGYPNRAIQGIASLDGFNPLGFHR